MHMDEPLRPVARHFLQVGRRTLGAISAAAVCAGISAMAFAQQAPTPPQDMVFKNATVMTASHGTIEHGSVWVHAGKIAGVGATVNAPADSVVVDASGLWLTPGIIDPHSHSALDGDVNEATSPVTPSMHMIDAFDNRDKALYQALAGGVTTELLLHGSANMIGGQAVVIKNKLGLRPRGYAVSQRAGFDQICLGRESEARLRQPQSVAVDAHGQLRGDAAGV